MNLLTEPNVNGGCPELLDFRPPAVSTSVPLAPPVTPAQRVFFYSPDEWEIFIVEWANGLAASYRQIKKLGGPGDRGVDVAAFKTDRGLEGAWDCFQAKHYEGSLSFSDVFPEMVKMFHSVVDSYYCLPDRYVFVAPRGCGSTLNRLLSKPTELQDKFLRQLNKSGAIKKKYGEQVLESIRELAASIDFSIFQSLELDEMLEVHRATPYYATRFEMPLPDRPPVEHAPVTPKPDEAVYVQKLVDVYNEQDPVSCSDVDSVTAHAKYGSQFQRHREAFYAAEALRLYARDSVPDGTYERLQDDVYIGVIDTVEANYSSGLARLQAVLAQSVSLNLHSDRHRLISVLNLEDYHGICHQLANADKLTWVDTDE